MKLKECVISRLPCKCQVHIAPNQIRSVGIWKEAIAACMKLVPRHSFRKTEENYVKSQWGKPLAIRLFERHKVRDVIPLVSVKQGTTFTSVAECKSKVFITRVATGLFSYHPSLFLRLLLEGTWRLWCVFIKRLRATSPSRSGTSSSRYTATKNRGRRKPRLNFSLHLLNLMKVLHLVWRHWQPISSAVCWSSSNSLWSSSLLTWQTFTKSDTEYEFIGPYDMKQLSVAATF
jgi:hypothetical protein